MAFRSYGSYGSFTNTSQKKDYTRILDANRKQSEDFDRQEYLIRQQEQSYMNVMRQKIRDEQMNRANNFKTEQQFEKTYQDAVINNMRQEVKNSEVEAESKERFWSAISEFSMTAAEKYTDEWIKQEEKNNLAQFYQALNEIDQMDPSDRNLLFGMKKMEENESAINYAISNSSADAVAERSGEIEAEPIRQTGSGYKQLIWQKAKAAYAAKNMDQYFEQNLDTKFDVEDQEGNPLSLTFEEIKNRGDQYLLSQATTQMKYRVANIAGVDKLDPVWAAQNFFQPADSYITKYEAVIKSDTEERKEKQLSAEQDRIIADEVRVGFINQMNPDSTLTVGNIINRIAAGSGPQYKKENGDTDYQFIRDKVVLPEIQQLVAAGEYDDDLPSLLAWVGSQKFIFNGNQVSTLEETNSTEYSELKSTINGRIKNQQQQTEQFQNEKMKAEIDQRIAVARSNSDGVIDQVEFAKLEKWAQGYQGISNQLYRDAIDYIGEFRTYDSESIDKNLAFAELLQQAQTYGSDPSNGVTDLIIQQNSWLTDAQQQELDQARIKAGPVASLGKEDINRKWVQSRVLEYYKGLAKAQNVDSLVDQSLHYAAMGASANWQVTYEEYLKEHEPYIAAQKAYQDTMIMIKDQQTQGGSYQYVEAGATKGYQGYVNGFSYGSMKPGSTKNYNGLLTEIQQAPKLLEQKLYLDPGFLRIQRTAVENGDAITYNGFINEIANRTNTPAFEVLNKQMKYFFGADAPEIQKGAIDELKYRVKDNPALDSLLTKPTQVGINTAIIGSGNAISTVRKGTDGEKDIQSLAALAGFKAPPLAAAMWALETGRGAKVHGPNALFNIKSEDGQGTRTTTKEYINGQWVATPASFKTYGSPLESVNDLKAWAENAPGFNEANTYREAIQAIYDAGYATDPKYVSKTLDILAGMGFNPDGAIYQHTGSVNNDPTYMRPAVQKVFYETGNIMAPGMAPSEHLDVKQADNPNTPENEALAFFPEDALKNYVVVEDAEFGDISLSGLAKAYYKNGRPYNTTFYAPRAYRNGTHLGWDYPTANGSKLRLKGGARVVGGYNTQFGYKAIIELPDGKRFAFLHGSKAQ